MKDELNQEHTAPLSPDVEAQIEAGVYLSLIHI